MGAYLISNCRSSTVSIGFDFLLPIIHFFTLARFSLLKLTGLVAVGTTLGQPAGKGRGGVVNVPPIVCAAGITAIAGHRLQIETGAQAFGGDGIADRAAKTPVKNAVPGYIGGLLPKTADSSEITQ